MKIEIRRITDDEKRKLKIPDVPENINGWSVWECEPSSFDWLYSEQEIAYVFEGNVIVKTESETIELSPGDFVTFPKGLSCCWDVKKTIRKVYKFV